MQRSEEKHRGKGYLMACAFIIFAWHLLAIMLDSVALPSPLEVLFTFINQRSFLLPHLLISLIRVVCGIALAVSIAVPLGLLSHEDEIDKLIAPIVYLLYPIPHIVLLPLIILLFGLGNLSKVILIAIIVFFQILVTTRDAARNLNRYYVYSMLSLGAGKRDVYKHVIFPACLPKILTAMRISIGTSIAVLFFVESFATTKGLGYLIMDSWSRADYLSLYANIIAMALLGFSLYVLLEKIEKRACKWIYIP